MPKKIVRQRLPFTYPHQMPSPVSYSSALLPLIKLWIDFTTKLSFCLGEIQFFIHDIFIFFSATDF